MALVDVKEIDLGDSNSEHLLGGYLGTSVSREMVDTYVLHFQGWVLGRNSQAVKIEFEYEGMTLQGDPVNSPRQNIAEQYPDVSWAVNSGFRAEVNTLRMRPEFEVLVRVVLQDGNRVLFAKIKGQRSSLSSSFKPITQPLLLTTLGRTGSTWLTQLLGQHPEIVSYRPFQYEPRVLTYWMAIIMTLTEPASYVQQIIPKLSGQHWWIGDPFSSPSRPIEDWQVEQWLGRDNVEDLVGFCQGQVEACYERIAEVQKQKSPRFFAEKFAPGYNMIPALIREIYPQRREIFLVRDFRDMICSMASYTKKKANARFFQDQANTIQDYIPEVRNAALCLLQNWRVREADSYLLRYEDLIGHPTETLTSVLDYLNLDAGLETVQTMLQKAAARVPGAQKQHQTSRNPAASIGRWRHDLEPVLYEACQEAFGGVLREFGYEVAA